MNLEEFKQQSGIRESAPLTSASFSTKAADDAKYGTDAFGVASKYADKFLRGTKDVMVGIGKQAANTVLGVSRLGERYLMNPLTGGAFAKNKFSADVVESALPAGALEQKNLAQKAGGLLFDIGSFAIPSTGVAKIATRLGRATGTALKAGGTAQRVAGLAQKATTLGGISAGEGLLGTAYGAIQEGQLNKEALTQGAYGAILPVAFAGAGKVLGTAGDLIKFGATKASGLEKETVEQIIKGKVPKEAMEEVNRQSLTRKVGDALLEERNALRDTGQAYNELRNAGEGLARVEMGAFQDVIDKYKLSVKNGKLVQTADTLPMSDTDLNQINKFFQTYSGDLDANKFLNARQFLAEEAKYDKLLAMTGKSKTGSQLAADLRSSLNKQADNFTVGNKTLGKIDAEYAPMKRDLDDVYKKIIDKDGELKDSAYSVVANLTGDAKTSVLASLKKYIPDIDEQVRVLKAVEDISRTMNTKTGTYIASILQGGGVLSSVATGNPAFLLTLLANPKFIIPMLRWYGSVVGKSNAFVQAVMKKILGGEALDQAETKFVQETLETAARKSKKLAPKTKPKQAAGLTNDLVSEAKKYKSADDFIKAQGTPVYRGSTNAARDERTVSGVISTSENPDIAKIFKGKDGKFEEFVISPNAKIIKLEDITKELKKTKDQSTITTNDWIDYAKVNGYDAIDMKSLKLSIQSKIDPNLKGFEDEIKILNKDILKTKSQLTEIWNQANSNKRLTKELQPVKVGSRPLKTNRIAEVKDVFDTSAQKAKVSAMTKEKNEYIGAVLDDDVGRDLIEKYNQGLIEKETIDASIDKKLVDMIKNSPDYKEGAVSDMFGTGYIIEKNGKRVIIDSKTLPEMQNKGWKTVIEVDAIASQYGFDNADDLIRYQLNLDSKTPYLTKPELAAHDILLKKSETYKKLNNEIESLKNQIKKYEQFKEKTSEAAIIKRENIEKVLGEVKENDLIGSVFKDEAEYKEFLDNTPF